jgi:hypothetical protein
LRKKPKSPAGFPHGLLSVWLLVLMREACRTDARASAARRTRAKIGPASIAQGIAHFSNPAFQFGAVAPRLAKHSEQRPGLGQTRFGFRHGVSPRAAHSAFDFVAHKDMELLIRSASQLRQ